MSPLQWNPKVVAITVIAGVILLYAATAILPGRQKTEETSRRREEHDAFKSANLEGPEDLEKFHPTKAHNQKDLETKEKQIASARGDDSKTKMNVRAEDTQVENAVPEGILEASEKTKLSLVDIEEKRIIFNTGGKVCNFTGESVCGIWWPNSKMTPFGCHLTVYQVHQP